MEWSLPVAFHFSVKLGVSAVSFSEVSGLESSIATEEVHSGGDNSTVFHLPKTISHSDLVLKRAVMAQTEPFFAWCKKNIESTRIDCLIDPQPIEVSLLDSEGLPVATWNFEGAYPFKWSFGTLDASKSELIIETISLKYRSVKRIV